MHGRQHRPALFSRLTARLIGTRSTPAARPSQPRAYADTLEPRSMLAADLNLSFDFQNPRDRTADGYIADTGKAFSKQSSKLSYGWDKDNREFTRNRRTPEKQRYDTIAFLGIGDSASKWEVALPTGLYEVSVVAGDARYADGNYSVKAEGSTLINKAPTAKKKFAKGSANVWVSDGRLTLTSAYNAEGNKLVSVSIRELKQNTAAPAVRPSPAPTPTNPTQPGTPDLGSTPWSPPSANISKRDAVAGMVNNEMPVHQAIPIMKSLGMKSVRIWYEITSPYANINWGEIKEAAAYKAAGMTVTVAFVNKTVDGAQSMKSFYDRLASNAEVRKNVDYWEIGNEMNMPQYWNSSLQSYVQNELKPAYEALKRWGEPVVGGGLSWDVNAAKQLQAAGYSNYCDYVGFHPYGESGTIVADRARGARAAFGNKPMMITEWNVQFVRDSQKWAQEITIAAKALSEISYLSYYYALRVDGTHVGQGGVVHSNGTPNGPFYNAVKSWTA